MPKNIKDIKGCIFGRWKVIEYVKDKKPGAWWLCECECKNKTRRVIKGTYLRNGQTKSCGCLQREIVTKIGESKRQLNEYEEYEDYIIGYTSNGKFYIDKDDYCKVKIYHWYIDKWGYVTTKFADNNKSKTIKMHKLIYKNEDTAKYIDHINGIKFDNRKLNLRIVTPQENAMNHTVKSNNSSGYSGVDFVTHCNKWRSRIKYKYKEIYLGLFKTKEEAIKAREKAEEKYFGNFNRRRKDNE